MQIGPQKKVLLGANFRYAIVTNGDSTVYICYSTVTRPSSEITLGRLVNSKNQNMNQSQPSTIVASKENQHPHTTRINYNINTTFISYHAVFGTALKHGNILIRGINTLAMKYIYWRTSHTRVSKQTSIASMTYNADFSILQDHTAAHLTEYCSSAKVLN